MEMTTTTNGEVVLPLSIDEENFALAVVEHGGNIKAAYVSVFGDTGNAGARGKRLLMDPRVSARVIDLNGAVAASSLITMESHLIELANIRDLAKSAGSLKVALAAEESRGKVAGYYVTRIEAPAQDGGGADRLARLADRLLNLQRGVTRREAEDVEIIEG